MTKDIFGKKIKYKFRRFKPDEEAHGYYYPKEKLIDIDNRQKGDERRITILHEELHAICDVTGLSKVMGEHVEELTVDTFSRWIIENYKIIPRKK